MRNLRYLTFAALTTLTATALSAEPLTLPSILGDHMVLQRGVPAPLWGRAEAGADVHIDVAGKNFTTKAAADGSWLLRVGPFDAQSKPTEITISSGDKTLTLHDVLIGDAWIAAGQSNMEVSLLQSDNGREFAAAATDPAIRLFIVRRSNATQPRFTCDGRWVVCSPETAGTFSAVGFHFAREIRKHQDVPIGMIGIYAGGTKIEAWTSLTAYLHDPLLADDAKRIQESIDTLDARRKAYTDSVVPAWQRQHDKWEADIGTTFRPALDAWNKQSTIDRAAGKQLTPKPKPSVPEPKKPDPPTVYSLKLSGLYNAMVAPVTPYGVKGILWYQGESNADNPARYRSQFAAMIGDSRAHFEQPDVPFLFVQLPNFVSYPDADWPGLRESQAAALDSVKNTAMAVSIDVGNDNDLHPKRKWDIAYRLTLAARALAYGEHVDFQSPALASVKIEGPTANVTFKNSGEGLHIGTPTTMPAGGQSIMRAPSKTPTVAAFTLAGEDGQFHPATAKIISPDTLAVTSQEVPKPLYVRYAWANTPHVNLYNAAGLPAAPFRTDHLPLTPPATQPAE